MATMSGTDKGVKLDDGREEFSGTAKGVKLDNGKIPIHRGCLAYFPRALKAVAEVSQVGARKYTWKGWESVANGVERYSDAMARHDMSMAEGETHDPETGLMHAAHRAWNALAILELLLRERKKSAGIKADVYPVYIAARPELPPNQSSIPNKFHHNLLMAQRRSEALQRLPAIDIKDVPKHIDDQALMEGFYDTDVREPRKLTIAPWKLGNN